ncbi:GATA zinc finger domain-containing protein 4-like [Argonauta hians]
MIEKMQNLYTALKEESKILQDKFSQTSAETIYYTFLNNKQKNDDQDTPNSLTKVNKSEPENSQICKPKDVSNKASNKKNNKNTKLNKNKLLYDSLANEYSFMKCKTDCENEESLYNASTMTANTKSKQSKTSENNAKKRQKQKRKRKAKDKNKKQNENILKEEEKKNSKNKKNKSDSHKDVASKPTKTGEEACQLLQALKEDHCLLNWKKNSELAELSFLEYTTKKGVMKVDQKYQQNPMENQDKMQSPNLKIVIHKSLNEDYHLCLRQKKIIEDNEIVYQKYLSRSSLASKSKAVSKNTVK